MEVEFLVLKEIIKILPFEFIENLWDPWAFLFFQGLPSHIQEQGVKSNNT